MPMVCGFGSVRWMTARSPADLINVGSGTDGLSVSRVRAAAERPVAQGTRHWILMRCLDAAGANLIVLYWSLSNRLSSGGAQHAQR